MERININKGENIRKKEIKGYLNFYYYKFQINILLNLELKMVP